METIFLSIAVGAMRDVVQLGRDASRDANKTFLGSLFRTTGTSSSKLELADRFRTDILLKKDALKTLDNDTLIYLELKEIINNLILDACEIAKNEKNEGHFGQYLAILNGLIDGLYCSMKTQGWLNLPDDGTPFNTFLRHCAEYDYLKLLEINCSRVLYKDRYTSSLTEEKRKVIYKSVKSCKKDIEGLDTSLEDYSDRVIEKINDKIEYIITQNEKLCAQYSYSPEIGIFSLSIASVKWSTPKVWQPGPGDIETCMEALRIKLASLGEEHRVELAVVHDEERDNERGLLIGQ